MSKKSIVLWVLAFGLFAGCGKNQGYYGYPLYQAPGYPAGMSSYPGVVGYPGTGAGYGNNFMPQMPQGYPSAYTPFLPIDNFMRGNPQLAAYWPTYWASWQVYCSRYGYSPYNFSQFWFVFTAQQWNMGGYSQLYAYMNQTFYYWASPQTQFAPNLNPATFWGNYQGYGYGSAYGYPY